MIDTGLRGVGKTVLLALFRRKALARDWVVVEFEVSKHDDTEFVATSPLQRALPMTMVAAGLPHTAELAGDAMSDAERLFRFPQLGNLEPVDAREALVLPAGEEGATYARAMAELGSAPQKASDVAGVMGRTSTNLGPTRAELINMGLLSTPEHGYAAFTVPHFDRFLRRAIPTLDVPPRRPRRKR